VRDAIIADYGIAPERVTVVGGGVNLPTLPALNGCSADDHPTALFIGADFYRKGGDLVLQAFAQVRKKIPNAQLLFLTADPIPLDLPLAGVQVITPQWDRQAIDVLYRRSDVFVLPSRLETWGDVFLEAMAYGLPCIGVSGEAMSEIIVDGATGVVVPPGDAQELANAMMRLLSDPALRRQWGRAARQRVESTFTWNQVVAAMAPVIASVVERKEGNL
jgi:glycosyltransferase involved in cell wall biosynthesis